MDGNYNIVMLLSLVVAIVAILKLRSVLGKRTSDDEARIDRQMRARQAREEAAAAGDKVVTLPPRQQEDRISARPAEPEREPIEERVKSFGVKSASAASGLIAIGREDPEFDPKNFMDGAKQAYEMIVTAFAEGNRGMLKSLLSDEVFAGFDAAINDREARGEQIDQSFVGIHRSEFVEASLERNEANVTIRFLSQLITAVRDSNGDVVSGDPQKVQEVTDIWTFARDVTSPNPNWFLIATQAPG
jgi:predicted lipid-binding transport protein (Tim44 family)